MSWWQVVVLAVLQGVTEFLPVSSSGNLAIASRMFFAGDAGASFTAVIQIGTELAARFGFLLAIPAVFASGLFSLPDAFHPVSEGLGVSGPQLLVAALIAFVVGFFAVAWFLRFVVRHRMYWFVGYRVTLGVVVLILLATGVVTT
jgi:undecaprenyl-diphosphatase